MLINKLQTINDVEQFRSLPAERLEETETLVGKVKEKKMGELFANMDKMDIQAERRKTAEAVKRAEEEREKGISREEAKVTCSFLHDMIIMKKDKRGRTKYDLRRILQDV